MKIDLNVTNYYNKEKYNFYPRKSLNSLIKKNFSAQNIFLNSKNKENTITTNNSILNDINNIKKFPKLKENRFYTKKKYPPIYFYRKTEFPYKYNISSIPEYLTKSSEEKIFFQNLDKNLSNEEKKIFDGLKNSKKDIYKPEMLEVNNILKYRPKYYYNIFNFSKKSENIEDKRKKIVFTKEDNNEKSIKNKEKIIDRKSDDDIKNKISLSRNNSSDNKFKIKMNSFSSVGYNILSPSYKGYNKFITPSELNKDNLYNESPVFHRLKSIGEFDGFSNFNSSFNNEKTNNY